MILRLFVFLPIDNPLKFHFINSSPPLRFPICKEFDVIRYLTAGESHGQALVGVVEGVPAGVSISTEYVNHQLWRRQQGYGRGGRMKIESDSAEILSGVRFGKTLGTPIALRIQNKDWPNWIERMSAEGDGRSIEKVSIPRPGLVI